MSQPSINPSQVITSLQNVSMLGFESYDGVAPVMLCVTSETEELTRYKTPTCPSEQSTTTSKAVMLRVFVIVPHDICRDPSYSNGRADGISVKGSRAMGNKSLG
jgi:hypothetical protein